MNYSPWKTAALALVAVVSMGLALRSCSQRTNVASTGTTLIQTAQLVELPAPSPTVETAVATPAPEAPVKPKTVAPKKKNFAAPKKAANGSPASPALDDSLAAEEAKPEPPLEPIEPKTHIIVEGGAGFSAPAVNPSIDNSCCRIGLVAGIAAEVEVTEALSVVPGLRYGQRGGRAKIGGSDIEVALDYLEAPMLVKYRFGTQDVKPFVLGGVTPAYNLRSQGRSLGFVRDINSKVSNFDISLEVGFGVEIPVNESWAVLISNRYSLGLIDVDKSGDVWRSRSLQLLGGLRFTLP